MKPQNLRIYIFEILIVVFLLLTCLYNNIITRQITAVVLLVFMVVILFTVKNNKTKSIRSTQITVLMSTFGVIFITLKYIIGMYLGFYNATVTFSLWSILNYILPYIVIIVSTEIIRKELILTASKNDILAKILYLIIMVLLDISLLTNIQNVKTLKEWFEFVALILFPAIANNLLYNFIINNFREEKGIIIYRILTTLYIFLIPIIPNLDVLLESILNLVIPCIIYIILTNYLNQKKEFSIKKDRIEKILVIIAGTIAVLAIMLVSCKFKYGALVIGSGSMTGTINKGDIIIYEAYEKDKQDDNNIEIKKGDIIVFAKDTRKTIHRVIDKRIIKGKEVFYTKGDANQLQDDWYVTEEEIVGIYKGRIPYIGKITLSINKLFAK